jgi:adenylyltransferase/sulfurtransferase
MSDVLFIDDVDRYSRLRLIAWWDQERLRASKVLVVGAGAIGNEVLKNLALIGIGHVVVVDFDDVEDNNLTRSVLFRREHCGKSKAVTAAEAIRTINPDVRVTPIHGNIMTDVGLGVFREADVVIGCLDNREARLWVNRSCWKVGTPWIDGGIQEINGVVKVFTPPDSACYECAMTENDYRLINLRYSCPLLKREELQSGKVPTSPTIASIIGGLQVQEALKILHGLPVESGTAMIFNGVTNQFYKTAFQRKDDCLSHETYPEPIEISLSAAKASAEQLFAAAKNEFDGVRELTLLLDRDLVVSLECACSALRSVMKVQQHVDAAEAICRDCGQVAKPHFVHAISAGCAWAKEPLSRLGIPAYDIVRVGDGNMERMFLLAGDRQVCA